MSETEFLRSVPVVSAPDMAAAKAFYTGVLGFTVAFEQGPAYAGVVRGPVAIHLDGAAASPQSVRIEVSGIDALYAGVDPSKVKPDETLETMPWGLRQFSVVDPAGNRITFSQQA